MTSPPGAILLRCCLEQNSTIAKVSKSPLFPSIAGELPPSLPPLKVHRVRTRLTSTDSFRDNLVSRSSRRSGVGSVFNSFMARLSQRISGKHGQYKSGTLTAAVSTFLANARKIVEANGGIVKSYHKIAKEPVNIQQSDSTVNPTSTPAISTRATQHKPMYVELKLALTKHGNVKEEHIINI